MTDASWIMLISAAVTVLFMLGTPVLLVIFYWVIGCSFVIDLPIDNTGNELLNVFNKGFALLAMPLFILTGDLINQSGIARRLSDFAYSCLGWLRGGLAMASIAACGLFAAISGSNSATTATIGSMLHPEMVKGGYDERFSAATAAAGGTVGIIIPPSIIFIVYGFKTAVGAWLGFFAIGLVLWCIYTGKASPTEAAGVTVGFCVFVGALCYPLNKIMGSGKDIPVEEKSILSMFVVEGFTLVQLPGIVTRSAQITGILVPLIAVSVAMQQVMSSLGAKEFISAFVTGMGGYYAVLFTAMAIVFVTGMILESLPVTIILAPILAPIAADVGVDPIHFAVIFLVGASIGFITPPYGLNLYVASGVTGVPYFRLLRYATLYLVSLLSIWMVIALVPTLSTMLLKGG